MANLWPTIGQSFTWKKGWNTENCPKWGDSKSDQINKSTFFSTKDRPHEPRSTRISTSLSNRTRAPERRWCLPWGRRGNSSRWCGSWAKGHRCRSPEKSSWAKMACNQGFCLNINIKTWANTRIWFLDHVRTFAVNLVKHNTYEYIYEHTYQIRQTLTQNG